ncbi:hypothetical protein H7H78_18975 [Mycobacterium shinjukuense]|uniref:Uncharacterized protein n=1 Tax=Mycobacterium shinjukuense TaxID=398694 RepID=A0A7I7MT33_9MYCO|nr:hypothetical protein [Mycobacterium shinjukuense]MCV6987412.1 hypothetical protein [Mycobacterium shinjukuense]ORB65947.1 hypothetical protein BST45_14215 [Mycobacterium shinjukuense]BBX74673.1 hypothetical protein MSHI_25790 [Mycobacterium shinjukuense]
MTRISFRTHAWAYAESCGLTIRPRSTTNAIAACTKNRAWAIPAVAVGWLLVTGFLVVWVHNGHSQDRVA